MTEKIKLHIDLMLCFEKTLLHILLFQGRATRGTEKKKKNQEKTRRIKQNIDSTTNFIPESSLLLVSSLCSSFLPLPILFLSSFSPSCPFISSLEDTGKVLSFHYLSPKKTKTLSLNKKRKKLKRKAENLLSGSLFPSSFDSLCCSRSPT